MVEDLLWSHQIQAIKMLIQYIDDYHNGDTNQAALVQMPTGSGKSGVIAYLSRCLPDIGLTIVLTPRISLRDQLSSDISGRFFKHIGYPVDELKKEVKIITEGSSMNPKSISSNLVIIMTIQMMVSIEKNNTDVFNLLSSNAELLIIDEGHYEPAKEWSKTIRKIEAPKVIFTATPFRNDFKVFDIDKHYCFILTFIEAQTKNYLRQVEFIERSSLNRKTPKDFINDLLDFYDSNFSTFTEKPRVIIRCDDSASIRHLAYELRNRGRSVIGIHETFTDNDWERKNVPNIENEQAVFWIHQFKLLEGIDDYRFQVLAIYEKITNARSLVQQIGRIIRNPHRQQDQVGYVLDHWNGFHQKLWNGFLKYDAVVNDLGMEAFEIASGQGIIQKAINFQPKIFYIDGRFRSQFDFDDINPIDDVQLPLKTNLLEKLASFNIDNFIVSIVEEYKEKDYIYHIYNISDNMRVVLYVAPNNSDILVNHVFIEAQLNIFMVCEFDDYVCIFDSSKANYAGDIDNGVGFSIDVKKLKKLFAQRASTKLTTVSLYNSNLGKSSIRSRSITAVSLEDTIPFFDDYAQICTTAEGYVLDNASAFLQNKTTRRYVGFSSGRIAQRTTVTLPQYIEWLEQLKIVLEENIKPSSALTRYALEDTIPNSPEPISILLDVNEIEEHYALCSDPSVKLQINDACSDVKDGRFRITANDMEVEAIIKYSNGKYVIECKKLDELYFNITESYPPSITKCLNNTQAFRILPKDYSTVYLHGQFYKPSFKIGRSFDPQYYSLKHCFIPDEIIGKCNSEKGSKTYYDLNDDTWDPDSLFGIIASLGRTTTVTDHFGDPDIVICDDVGTEIADFIYCDTKTPKVIFIHAKADSNTHNCSTSKLHDVCGQATKNLGYLAMFNDNAPSKLNSWQKPWKAKVICGNGKVKSRIVKIHKEMSPTMIWKQIRACINNPQVEKEVWLFLGNIISQEYFEKELAKNKPAPHVIQAAYLLHATMTDAASVGAKLKVFCMK